MNQQLKIDWADVPQDIAEGFHDFHAANPHVYLRLVEMTRNLVARKRHRIGMKMLFEVLRWEHYMKTEGEAFKLNNNYTAFYSRLIESQHPEYLGVFTKRASLADEGVE